MELTETDFISYQELHNRIALQPSVSDKVQPLLLLDCGRHIEQFNKHGRIHWSIHCNTNLLLMNENHIEQQDTRDDLIFLDRIANHGFSDQKSSGSFKWRSISCVVLYHSKDTTLSEINIVHKIYQCLKRENKCRNVKLLEGTLEQFLHRYPYMISFKSFKDSEWEYPTEVLPGLYLGSKYAAQVSKPFVKQLNMRFIVNCAAKECDSPFADFVEYLKLPLEDDLTQEISLEVFMDTANFIHNKLQESRRNKSSVLVHCVAGRSRSVCIMMAYLIIHLKWSLAECEAFMKIHRPIAIPNSNFRKLLQQLEQQVIKS